MTNESTSECQWDIGFIVTRHVNKQESNKVWIQCVKQIRKFYPDYPIVILDDNSNQEFVSVDEEAEDFMDNVHVHFVEPEHYKSAELLPYYYNYVNKWFDTMIFIQDSIFMNSYYDFRTVDKVKFIAYYDEEKTKFKKIQPDYNENIRNILLFLDNHEPLIEYSDKNTWQLCWGMMSVIQYPFLKHINEKYNFKNLLYKIKSHDVRIWCERVLGVIFCFEVPSLETDPSVFGNCSNITDAGYNYNSFISGILPDSYDIPILKVSLNR